MARELIVVKEGKVTINNELILVYKSFNSIWKQDDTNKKYIVGGERAIKEIGYVGIIAGNTSVPNMNGYSEAEADEYARDKLGLPKTWQPSLHIQQAIIDYQDETASVAKDTINELLKTFRLTKLVIAKIRASLQARLTQASLTAEQAVEILNQLGLTIKYAAEVPKITRDLRDAIHEYNVEEDDEDDVRMRGTGEKVPDSMIPEKSL